MAFIVGGLLLTGCSKQAKKKEQKTIKTETITVGSTALGETKDYVGTIEEKIGQLFIVRYENIDEEDEVKQYQLGGITFYGKDFRYEDKDSIIELINSLQSDVKIPMFMSVDEEGGSVARVSRWYQYRSEIFLSPRDYYEQGGLDLVLQMEEEKADIIKESERKISECVNNGILVNNIKLVEKGKLLATDAAEACDLGLEEFLKKKEEYESSTLA